MQSFTRQIEVKVNTSFEYLYRDAANYKVFETVILCGALRIDEVTPFLHEGEFFIPSQVGLCDLQPPVKTEFDHVWHEVVEVKLTDKKATIPLTTEILSFNFRVAADNRWRHE